ncbi:MAG: hypothetical protein IPI07_02895 [Flavobacteriales bacterium]|nr:hypothetical protein [Flavobacteriales bacterium]
MSHHAHAHGHAHPHAPATGTLRAAFFLNLTFTLVELAGDQDQQLRCAQ